MRKPHDPAAPKRPYKSRWPEASYGPEWRELWLRASRTAFHYDFPSPQDLTRTRMRAQHFRNQQRALDRPGWELLYRATTTIDPILPTRLHFRPVEDPHRSFFQALGIESEPGSAPASTSPKASAEASAEAASISFDPEDWMTKLVKSKQKDPDT